MLWLVFRYPFKASYSHRWAFEEVAGSRVCGPGTDSWCNARFKDTKIKDVNATCPKQPG